MEEKMVLIRVNYKISSSAVSIQNINQSMQTYHALTEVITTGKRFVKVQVQLLITFNEK